MFRLQKRCYFQGAAVFDDVISVLCDSCKRSIIHVILLNNYVTVGSVIIVGSVITVVCKQFL